MHGQRTDIFIIALRILAGISLILLVYFAPSWVTLGVALFYAGVFKKYIELMVIGVVLDLVYAPGLGDTVATFSGVYTLVTVGLFAVIAMFKKRLSWYN